MLQYDKATVYYGRFYREAVATGDTIVISYDLVVNYQPNFVVSIKS